MKRTWIMGLATAALVLGTGVAAGASLFVAPVEANAEATQAYVKIDKTADLAVGDQVVLAYVAGDVKKELSSFNTSKNIGEVSDFEGSAPAGKVPLVVTAGSAEGKFAFKTGEKYLSWSSGNTLITSSDVDASSSWTVSIADGDATIVNVNDTSRKLQYNSGSPRFACYATSQKLPQLFKLTSIDSGSVTGVELDKSFVISKSTDAVTLTATVSPDTATDKSVTWTSSDETVATVANGVVTPKKKGAVTITATTTDGGKTASASIAFADHVGTSTDPLTPADVLIVKEVAPESGTTDKFYVKGDVKALSWSGSSGAYQADITLDDGGDGFDAYHFYDGDFTTKFADQTKIKVGDTVTLQSAIYNDTVHNSLLKYGAVMDVTSNVTLTSVALSGEVTIPQYVGEDWDLRELVATATYSDSSAVDVSSSATFTCDPVKPAASGEQKVTVTATYDGVSGSKDYVIDVIDAPEVTTDDAITYESFTFESGTGYKAATGKSQLGIAYDAVLNTNGTQTEMQFRTDSASGIVISSAAYGKYIKSVSLTYSDGKTGDIQLFASENTFTIADMFDGETKPYAVLNESDSSINLPVDTQYFGIRSSKGARYLSKVTVTYVDYSAADIAETVKTLAGGWDNKVATEDCRSNYSAVKTMILALTSDELTKFRTSEDTEIASARATYEFWCTVNGDNKPYEGEIVSASRIIVSSQNNNTIWLVLGLVGLTAIIATGLVVFNRKRRAE